MSDIRSKRQRQQLLLIIPVASLLVLWLYYAQLVKPRLKASAKLAQDIRTARVTLQHVHQAIARQPQLQQEEAALVASMESLRSAMPTEDALPSVIEQLSAMANQAGLRIQTIFPQRTLESIGAAQPGAAKPPGLYREIPIQIDALTGFHQLGNFLSRVEAGKQPMQLRSLRISRNPREPRRHNVKMVVTAYVAATEGIPSSRSVPGRSGQGGS